MQKTHNTLDPKIRQQSIDTLNKLLATSIDLHAQVKQAHWNVRGTNFIAIHELFDKVAEEAGEWSDLIAERTNGLGGPARGTIQVANEASELEAYPLEVADWPNMSRRSPRASPLSATGCAPESKAPKRRAIR